jgi:hypothetical protein
MTPKSSRKIRFAEAVLCAVLGSLLICPAFAGAAGMQDLLGVVLNTGNFYKETRTSDTVGAPSQNGDPDFNGVANKCANWNTQKTTCSGQ